MSGVIHFTKRLKYVFDDSFFTACRANLMHELFLYSNTDGVMTKYETRPFFNPPSK